MGELPQQIHPPGERVLTEEERQLLADFAPIAEILQMVRPQVREKMTVNGTEPFDLDKTKTDPQELKRFRSAGHLGEITKIMQGGKAVELPRGISALKFTPEGEMRRNVTTVVRKDGEIKQIKIKLQLDGQKKCITGEESRTIEPAGDADSVITFFNEVFDIPELSDEEWNATGADENGEKFKREGAILLTNDVVVGSKHYFAEASNIGDAVLTIDDVPNPPVKTPPIQ